MAHFPSFIGRFPSPELSVCSFTKKKNKIFHAPLITRSAGGDSSNTYFFYHGSPALKQIPFKLLFLADNYEREGKTVKNK